MERLFSPWRSEYIGSFSKTKKNEDEGCLFCTVAKSKNDAHNLILLRRRFCFVMMNLYPYNSGHVLIVPYTHTSQFSRLSAKEYADVMEASARVMEAVDKTMQPQGFNFGANLGRAAGAGIEQHIHFHIVPRWNGDTNFLPTLADTKLVSEAIQATYRKLKRNLSLKK